MSVDPKEESRRWLTEAHEELLAARAVFHDQDAPRRIACFLAHLAVEKAIKGLLVFYNVAFRKTHSLVQLSLLLPPKVRAIVKDETLVELDPWSLDGRYPGDTDEASGVVAQQVLDDAAYVIAAISAHIGSSVG